MPALHSIPGGKKGGKGTPKGQGSLDPFTMQDDSEYSTSKVYNRSTDGHGHSVNMQVRVAPDIAGEIGALIASQMIPEYRTSADLIRDALTHKLYEIAQRIKNGDLERRVTLEMRLADLESSKSEMDNLERMLTDQTAILQQALDLNDLAMMDRLLSKADTTAELMRDPYGEKLKEEIKSARQKYRRAVSDQARASDK